MSSERYRRSSVELDPQVVAAYAAIFIPRFDRYPIQKPDGTYLPVPHHLHQTIIEGHIKGNITIGAYNLDTENRAKWLCFDADDETVGKQVINLAQALTAYNIPTYLEQSRRGIHLWLFTDPLLGKDIRRFGKQLLAQHHITNVELYPKQDELRTGAGSFVRLPLGIHQMTKRRYSFITPDGTPLAPTIREQLALLSSPKRVPQAFIDNLLKDAPEPKPVFPSKPFVYSLKNQLVAIPLSERIKNRISVYDFVSQYVDLDRSGKGLCPFHDDHRMSFSVDQRGNYWRCFAKCSGNTVIDFWMNWREIHGQTKDFKETIIDLIRLLNL